MSEMFPIALSRKTRLDLLPRVPGQPEGRLFGYVEQGIEGPSDLAFYLVELDPTSPGDARVVAYGDRFGRLFDVREPQSIPPARYPAVQVFSDEDDPSLGTVSTFDERGESTAVARVDYARKRGGRSTLSLTRLLVSLSGDTSMLYGEKPFNELLGIAYLAFYLFGDKNAEGGPTDMAAIFARLSLGDVFDAVNGELLAAEQADDVPAIERYLVHMLREEGAAGLSVDDLTIPEHTITGNASDLEPAACAPEARLIRTADYADTFFIDFSYYAADDVVENGNFFLHPLLASQRATLLGVESALNRFLLLTRHLDEMPAAAHDEELCSRADLWLIDRIADQLGDPTSPDLVTGRWAAHYGIAWRCESVAVPYRWRCRYTSSPSFDSVGMEVLCPSAQAMPRTRREAGRYIEQSEQERRGMEARYAAHEALLACRMAFCASPEIELLHVNILRDEPQGDGSFPCLVSLFVSREAFCELWSHEQDKSFRNPFGALDALDARYHLGDGWQLEPVEPLFSLSPASEPYQGTFVRTVKADNTPLSPKARELLGVDVVKSLSIFEEGERETAAEEVLSALDAGGADGATAALKTVHDRTESLALRKLCTDLMDGFAAGTLDATSYLEVREAFTDAYGFKAPMTYAYALVNDDEEEQAVPVLEDLIAKTESLPGFSDTSNVAFRYFDSYATRAIYAWKCEGDRRGREVRQMPDEKFLAHDALAQVLTRSLGREDEALEHAHRCIEMAPARAQSYLRAARAYFMKDDYEHELAMCAQALEYAHTCEDAGLALYWAAYAYWQLGKFDLAAAAYRRCLRYPSSVRDHARTELEELGGDVKGLQLRSAEAEEEMLEEAGLPVRALADNVTRLLSCAQQAADCDAISLACVLGVSAQRVLHNDALMPTIRSLEMLTK